MDFDKPQVYGDTSITDVLVSFTTGDVALSENLKNLILFQKNIAHPIPPILENVGLGGLRSQDYKVWMPSTRPEIHKNLCIFLSSAFL